LIILDSNLNELGEVEVDIDIEIGRTDSATNDFEMTNATLQDLNPGGFYIPGTEFGGLIEYTKDRAAQDYTTLKGYTWRGLLSKWIIMPDAGEDYKVVSGEANSVIADLLNGVLGDFFVVSSEDSGCTITNYQFPLYINMLDGIELMLESYGYRLKLVGQKVAAGQPIQVEVSAVAATVVSGTFNEDNGIPMAFTQDMMGINHLICGGSGELQNRMIVHLYINQLGQISQTQYYTGFKERQEFFDFASAESEDDLIANGTEYLKENASCKMLEMEAPEDMELDIGDVVKGTFPDGTIIESPVISKVFAIKEGVISYEYKIKGEE